MKRQLPGWMLGISATDQASADDSNTNSIDDDIDDGSGSREDRERVNKQSGRRLRSKAKTVAREKSDDIVDGLDFEKHPEESSSLLVKCSERKQTRTSVKLDDEVVTKKKTQRTRGKKSIGTEDIEDFITEDCLENGEDEDLTVEDLMMIAKEYVRKENDAQQVGTSKEGHVSGSQSQDFAQSGSSLNVPQAKNRSFEGQETSSSCISTQNLTSEGAGLKPSMSSNPTQDMLDLFLGPLLKKTREEEKKVELEKLNFNFEAKKQNKSVVLGEEPATVTVTKKKSSLKEKISMFLD